MSLPPELRRLSPGLQTIHLQESTTMVNDSVGALHVALAAAIVGWLVFCISHSIAVWKKRNSNGEHRDSRGLLFTSVLLVVAALAAGWLDLALTRRVGVIQGTDFFVVRAQSRTTPHLAQGDSVDEHSTLATFDSPDANREEQQLSGEINVLETQIASVRLQPLQIDPELARVLQDVSDSQRARLSQLGYGVLGSARPASAASPPPDGGDLVAAQKAKNNAAKTQYDRTAALVQAGVVSRDKLDTATVEAQAAAQELRERENLIREAKDGSRTVQSAEQAILRDGQRAEAERGAEIAELSARLAEFRTNLYELHKQESITAPFSGTVVYRHPTPSLAGNGQVILALAKGPGFQATVQVPNREASMLVPGQELRMKFLHSLVSDEVSGRLQEIRSVPGYPNLRNLVISCNLPPEQFKAFSSGPIPVTLKWRPALYTDRVSQAGLLLSIIPLLAWVITEVRRLFARPSRNNQTNGWSYSRQEEEEFRQLGVKLNEDFEARKPLAAVGK
jgi:multidrug resistance efflux pump